MPLGGGSRELALDTNSVSRYYSPRCSSPSRTTIRRRSSAAKDRGIYRHRSFVPQQESFSSSTLPVRSLTWQSHPATVSRSSKVVAWVSTASASMTSGAYALRGVMAMLSRSRSLTTIPEEAQVAKRAFPPIHPGEILLEEFLKPMGVTQYRLAKDISVDPRRINA